MQHPLWNNAAAILSEKYFQGILGKRKNKGRGVDSVGKTLGRAIWNMVFAAFLLWLAAAGIGRLFFAERFRQDRKKRLGKQAELIKTHYDEGFNESLVTYPQGRGMLYEKLHFSNLPILSPEFTMGDLCVSAICRI